MSKKKKKKIRRRDRMFYDETPLNYRDSLILDTWESVDIAFR